MERLLTIGAVKHIHSLFKDDESPCFRYETPSLWHNNKYGIIVNCEILGDDFCYRFIPNEGVTYLNDWLSKHMDVSLINSTVYDYHYFFTDPNSSAAMVMRNWLNENSEVVAVGIVRNWLAFRKDYEVDNIFDGYFDLEKRKFLERERINSYIGSRNLDLEFLDEHKREEGERIEQSKRLFDYLFPDNKKIVEKLMKDYMEVFLLNKRKELLKKYKQGSLSDILILGEDYIDKPFVWKNGEVGIIVGTYDYETYDSDDPDAIFPMFRFVPISAMDEFYGAWGDYNNYELVWVNCTRGEMMKAVIQQHQEVCNYMLGLWLNNLLTKGSLSTTDVFEKVYTHELNGFLDSHKRDVDEFGKDYRKCFVCEFYSQAVDLIGFGCDKITEYLPDDDVRKLDRLLENYKSFIKQKQQQLYPETTGSQPTETEAEETKSSINNDDKSFYSFKYLNKNQEDFNDALKQVHDILHNEKRPLIEKEVKLKDLISLFSGGQCCRTFKWLEENTKGNQDYQILAGFIRELYDDEIIKPCFGSQSAPNSKREYWDIVKARFVGKNGKPLPKEIRKKADKERMSDSNKAIVKSIVSAFKENIR